MSELVPLEVREGDVEVAIEAVALAFRELGDDAIERAPPEASVARFVGPDRGEELAERPVGHRVPLGPDERHGHGLRHARDGDQISRRRLEP